MAIGGRVGWPDARVADLRRFYLDLLLPTSAVARRMGLPLRAVQGKIVRLQLAVERGEAAKAAQRRGALEAAVAARHRVRAGRGQVVWSETMTDWLRRRYLGEDAAPGTIAAELGLDVRAVRRKVKALGLFAIKRARGGRKARVRRLADVKATRVVRLAPGVAAGVSGWEMRLRAAPPPQGDASAKAAAAARGRAARSRAAELRRKAA